MLSSRGVLLISRCVLLLSHYCRAATIANESEQWFKQPFRMFQTNIREIDANLDVNETLDYIHQHGADTWLLSVGGILAFYPTDLPFQSYTPIQAEGRASGDLIRDARDASQARGVRLLGRMDFSKVDFDTANQNPEWAYISPEGDMQIHYAHGHRLVSMCPSGDWYQERIFDILDEVMGRYELDGFFVNWAGYNENDYNETYWGVCHCDSCKSRWGNYSGGAQLPDGPDDASYPEWKLFSDGVIDDWTGRVQEFISDRLPDAGLLLGESADIMFYEANNAVNRVFWHHATSETVSKFVSYRPDVPVLVNAASFLDHGYRICSEQPENYAQYFIQAISRGANPSTYIIGIPGKIPWLGIDYAAEITRFHQKWSDVYKGLKPIAKTALVLPDDNQITNETFYQEAVSEYKGLYQALQELHIPFDIIAQERITNTSQNNGLQRYDVVILPNLGPLMSSDVEALDNWAAAGGNLVTTGAIGVGENGDVQLQSLPAAGLIENITEPEKLWSTYLIPEQNRTEEGYYTAPLIPIIGSYHLFEWKNESEGRFKKLAQAPWAPIEYVYGNVEVDERGCGIGTYENGKGVVFTIPIGRGYREIGYSVYRDFFEMVLKELGSSEPLQFNIAEQVEVTINSNNDSSTVVHLINMSGARSDNFGSHLPIPAGSITVSGGNVTAHALVSDTTLEVVDGQIMLPGIDLFEVVVIDGLE